MSAYVKSSTITKLSIDIPITTLLPLMPDEIGVLNTPPIICSLVDTSYKSYCNNNPFYEQVDDDGEADVGACFWGGGDTNC